MKRATVTVVIDVPDSVTPEDASDIVYQALWDDGLLVDDEIAEVYGSVTPVVKATTTALRTIAMDEAIADLEARTIS